MQCTSYFPGCYTHQDLNGTANGVPWPMSTNDLAPNMSGQSYNNFYAPPKVDQIRAIYHNEVLRQTMLSHENIFREQVQELHRLHRRQRELMDEYKRRGLKEPEIGPIFHCNFTPSKVQSDSSSMTWQTPTLSSINPAANTLSIAGSKGPLSTLSFLDTSPQNGNGFENNELFQPKYKKTKQKMLDLELPADDYEQSEDEKGNEVQIKNSRCSNDNNVNMMAFDLNMPPTLSLESEVIQTNTEIENGAKSDHDDTQPPIHGVESKEGTKYPNEGLFETKSKIHLIDLNSCVDEDEPSPTLPISETIETMPKIDLEGPISPENKETLPPRGESEENLLETPVQNSNQDELDSNEDLLSGAAETILLMTKSSSNEKTIASLVESLDWFAGVVISANKREPYEAGMSSDGSGKEGNKCIVALPSQQGKRHRKRRMNRKISETEVLHSLSSLMSYDLGFGERGVKSWGKVNKRRRGPRVPASGIQLLWSQVHINWREWDIHL